MNAFYVIIMLALLAGPWVTKLPWWGCVIADIAVLAFAVATVPIFFGGKNTPIEDSIEEQSEDSDVDPFIDLKYPIDTNAL